MGWRIAGRVLLVVLTMLGLAALAIAIAVLVDTLRSPSARELYEYLTRSPGNIFVYFSRRPDVLAVVIAGALIEGGLLWTWLFVRRRRRAKIGFPLEEAHR